MRVRLHSFRSRALLACVPATALVLMAGAGTASAAHAPSHSRAATPATIERLLSHWHPTNHGVHMAVRRGPGLKHVTSHNWAGYADDNSSGNTYASVSGKWKKPTVSSCSTNGPLKLAVFWVGIDGFNSTTVEQDGTGAICGQGTALTYFTWHEMCCGQPIEVFGATVRPGDNISASVVRSGSHYTLTVTDSTTGGNSFSKSGTCGTCANSSAEWIAEAPTASTGEVPLPKFTTWSLTSASVKSGSTTGTISKFPDNEITMNNASPHNLATPTSLTSGGAAFKVVWKA